MVDSSTRTKYHIATIPNRHLTHWVTLEPLFIYTETAGLLHVPRFFESDGGSKPRPLWPLTGHPMSMDRYPAYFVHDHIYRHQYLTRKTADDTMYEIMVEHLGVDEKRAYSEWLGVRIGGWYGWRKSAKI